MKYASELEFHSLRSIHPTYHAQITYIFAYAAFDPMTTPQISPGSDHDDLRCSRVALLSLDRSSAHHIEGVEPMTWIGAWSLDANVNTLNLLSGDNGLFVSPIKSCAY